MSCGGSKTLARSRLSARSWPLPVPRRPRFCNKPTASGGSSCWRSRPGGPCAKNSTRYAILRCVTDSYTPPDHSHSGCHQSCQPACSSWLRFRWTRRLILPARNDNVAQPHTNTLSRGCLFVLINPLILSLCLDSVAHTPPHSHPAPLAALPSHHSGRKATRHPSHGRPCTLRRHVSPSITPPWLLRWRPEHLMDHQRTILGRNSAAIFGSFSGPASTMFVKVFA